MKAHQDCQSEAREKEMKVGGAEFLGLRTALATHWSINADQLSTKLLEVGGGSFCDPNREIVSFRSCVRAGEARRSCVGEREAIRL